MDFYTADLGQWLIHGHTRMKCNPETSTLELTARSIQALNHKLDDPLSARTLRSPWTLMYVTAVESAGAGEAVAAPGTVPLTRSQRWC